LDQLFEQSVTVMFLCNSNCLQDVFTEFVAQRQSCYGSKSWIPDFVTGQWSLCGQFEEGSTVDRVMFGHSTMLTD